MTVTTLVADRVADEISSVADETTSNVQVEPQGWTREGQTD